MRTEFPPTESTYEWRRDGWLAACAFAAVLLVISALTPHAPGFDTFLRIFVFCMALVRGIAGFRRGGAWLPLSAGLIAILFNPVRPVVTSASASMWLDLVGAAWFAVVGAWQLLRAWEPQRGWAAAALSLCALAVPAVAAFSAPNRDALTPLDVDENLAVMNAPGNAPAAAPNLNTAGAAAPAATPPSPPKVSAGGSFAQPAHADEPSSTTTATANLPTHVRQEVSTKNSIAPEPPLTSNEADSPANAPGNSENLPTEVVNNGADENQE